MQLRLRMKSGCAERAGFIRFIGVLVYLTGCLWCGGCSTVKKVQHLPQLLTLKGYSDSQARIDTDVKKADALFDEMTAEVTGGRFDYADAEAVVQRFGRPVFRRHVQRDGEAREQWLYRRATDFSGGRIYLDFDEDGRLFDFQYQQRKELPHEQETAEEQDGSPTGRRGAGEEDGEGKGLGV